MFALGSTLAWAATAGGPFAADQAAATLYRIISRPPDLRGVPPRVVEIVEACLVKDAARRPTAVQLAVWLRGNGACGNVPDGNVPGATTVAHPLGPPPAPPRRRGLGLGAGALAAVVAAGVVTAVALYSSAMPAAGAPTTISPAATASAPASSTVRPAAGADPAGPEVRYVDRLCAPGTLLSALGSTAIGPSPGSDPAQLRRDYLAAADRTIGTVEAALPDLTALRDEAPTPEIQGKFGLIASGVGWRRPSRSPSMPTPRASTAIWTAPAASRWPRPS